MAEDFLTPAQVRPASTLLEQIGNTPLLRLAKLDSEFPDVEIYAKAEFFNPGGSVKDRAARNMILTGIREGKFTKDKVLLDSTSGNTGIAYAMICSLLGYKVKLVMPDSASQERKRILKNYGAEVVFSPGDEGSDGAIRLCQEIYDTGRDQYFFPDQYSNPCNPAAHYHSTAVEIMTQTEGRLTHFIACMGTSGTFCGNTRRIKKDMPHVQCISAQPSTGFHGLEGLKHMPTAIVPKIYDESLADDNIWLETEDAYAMTRWLGRNEGLLVGMSSGANVWAAQKIAKQLTEEGKPGVIVTVLCDGATKYLSLPFWDEED